MEFICELLTARFVLFNFISVAKQWSTETNLANTDLGKDHFQYRSQIWTHDSLKRLKLI